MTHDTTSAVASQPASGYRLLRWLLPLALVHGLLFLVIVPPWQHYDEPAHFEYAWLIANGDHLPTYDEANSQLRREVANSMYRFRFYPVGQQPDMLVVDGPLLGQNQRIHPPLYYMLAALPLRLSSGLAVEQQLYLARSLSLGLYVLTIMAAWRIATVLIPEEPLIQLVIPLLLLLTPTYVDLMTAVNNDVLVNFCAVALLLGCALLIRDGPQLSSLALVILALGVALGTKRTALVLILPFLLSLVWAWLRRPLPIRLITAAVIGGGLALILISFTSGNASDDGQLFVLRPWLKQFDASYLRLDLEHWFLSATTVPEPNRLYSRFLRIGFTTFWVRLGWGQIQPGLWVDWALVAICAASGVGLIIQGWRIYGQLVLWQQRCIWLFLFIVSAGCLSMFIRLFPLSPYERPYIPTGRYIFTVMLPALWLLALGWQGLLPTRWQPYGPLALLGLWLTLDLLMWGGALVNSYYRLV